MNTSRTTRANGRADPLAGFSALALCFVFLTGISLAQSPPALTGTGVAAIDGILSPGEWDGAGHVDLLVNIPGGGTTPATLYVMNDNVNLYLALRFNRTLVDPGGNSLGFEFDNNNNGIAENGDDVIVYNPPTLYDDVRTFCPGDSIPAQCGFGDESSGGTVDGQGAFVNNGTYSVYEMSHPLNSGDIGHDFALKAGQTVGFFLQLVIIGGGGQYAETEFPGFRSYGSILISTYSPKQFGAIAGSVLVNGSGLAGVTVQLLGSDGNPVPDFPPVATDAQGNYGFTRVPSPAAYAVMIVEPLGYSADANPKPVSLAGGGNATVNFALTKNVLCDQARSAAYWKCQFDAYIYNRGSAAETRDQLTKDIAEVQQHYTPHFSVFAGKTSFSDWQAVLSPKWNASLLDQSKAQLAAFVLNLGSQKIGQYSVVSRDKRTAGDVLTFVSRLITKPTANKLEYGEALLLSLMVNNQVTILSGIVPKGNTLYKSESDGSIAWEFGVPAQYTLAQNYPNPFNPVTTISYALPEEGDVSLAVFNLQGQKVAQLVEGRMSAGYHDVLFDGSRIASGVYFYRIQSGSFVDTKKLVLVR